MHTVPNSLQVEAVWGVLADRAAGWPARVRDLPVGPVLSRREILDRLDRFDFQQSVPLDDAASQVAALLEQGTLHATHPRYFGLFVPGVRTSGLVADALTAIYNPQLGAWWHAPAATEIERHTLAWFARRIGMPAGGFSCFTTGGSEANLTGILAALARGFPGYGDAGLAGMLARPVFYLSDQAHDSFVKIARITGLGADAARRVPSDPRRRMDVAALARAIAADRAAGLAPFCVVATVGTTGLGAIDPLAELSSLCVSEGLWLHADAAYGGIGVLAERLRPHVRDLRLVDSITLDAHKVLPVPTAAGMYFARSGEATDRIFGVHTSYVPDAEPETTDAYQRTILWSRRFTGLKVFLLLAELGERGIEAMVEQQCDMADRLRRRLGAAGWTVANDTPLPIVCFTREGFTDDRIAAMVRAVTARGAAWISELRTNAGSLLRACITHQDVRDEDLDVLMSELEM